VYKCTQKVYSNFRNVVFVIVVSSLFTVSDPYDSCPSYKRIVTSRTSFTYVGFYFWRPSVGSELRDSLWQVSWLVLCGFVQYPALALKAFSDI